MAGPATDSEFLAAARRLGEARDQLTAEIRRWPAVDNALYGITIASTTSTNGLIESRDAAAGLCIGLDISISECVNFAAGCKAYYDAYSQWTYAKYAYDTEWNSYSQALNAPRDPKTPPPNAPTTSYPQMPICPPYCDPSPVR
jgi:hypothetical protein